VRAGLALTGPPRADVVGPGAHRAGAARLPDRAAAGTPVVGAAQLAGAAAGAGDVDPAVVGHGTALAGAGDAGVLAGAATDVAGVAGLRCRALGVRAAASGLGDAHRPALPVVRAARVAANGAEAGARHVRPRRRGALAVGTASSRGHAQGGAGAVLVAAGALHAAGGGRTAADRGPVRRRGRAGVASRPAVAGAVVGLAHARAVVRSGGTHAVARRRAGDAGAVAQLGPGTGGHAGQPVTADRTAAARRLTGGAGRVVGRAASGDRLVVDALAVADVEAAVAHQAAHPQHARRHAVRIGGAAGATGTAGSRVAVGCASGAAPVVTRSACEVARRAAAGGRVGPRRLATGSARRGPA